MLPIVDKPAIQYIVEEAIVELGLQRDELRPQLLAYLDILLQKELGKEKLRRRVV